MTQGQSMLPLFTIQNLKVSSLFWVDDQNSVKESGAYCVSDGKNYYGTVGGRYTPMDYRQAFDFVQKSLGINLTIVKYAANKQMSKGIITCESPGFSGGGIPGDPINLYINIVNSLDGSTPVGILVTPVRCVCMNQYRLLKQKAFIQLHYRHTAHGITLMQSQQALVQEVHSIFIEQVRLSALLQQKTIKDIQGDDIISDNCPKIWNERTRDIALSRWHKPACPEDQPRNEWVLFNCLTYGVNDYLNLKNRWSTVKELDRVGKFFAERI